MNPNNQQDEFNPADKNYEETFKNLADEEVKKAGKSSRSSDSESGSIDDSTNSLKDDEESGNGWYNPSSSGPQSGRGSFSGFVKKKGPIGLIAALILGGGIGIGALFSPAILIVQLKETMVGKFNQQLGSMDVRTMKLIDAKTKDATKGMCKTVKIKCKYATMSERQIKKFQAAGIDIEVDKEKPFGRSTIKSMSFNGQPISAGEFRATMLSDPEFRSAVKKAYNPMFAGFADKVWTKTKLKFGINERAPNKSKDVEEKKKDLQDKSKNAQENDSMKYPTKDNPDDPKEKYKHPLCSNPLACTDEEVGKITETLDKTKAYYNSAKNAFKPGKVGLSMAKSVGGAVGIVGYLDSACTGYYAIQLTSFAAKNIRTVQLARYAMQYFTVADMIKAGDAKPEDVSQLGTILTSISPGDFSDTKKGPRKSATDSFGYKYAAYGDSGNMSDQTSLFTANGGLTGTLSGVSDFVLSLIPGGKKNANNACRFVKNPAVQAGSLVAGLAFAIVPGVGWARLAGSVAIGVTIGLALSILPGILADILAGTVTDGIQGEDSGDAITSGAGALMGGVANAGGNAPLTKDQALAYNKLNQDTAIAYARDEASELSPLDASNRYTFMGSIAYSMMPLYSSSAFSIGGGLSSSLSMLGVGLNSLLPRASAVSDASEKAAMEICKDYDYVDMGIATDPFCNPMFGIPPEYLETDPQEVLDYLLGNGYIDGEGKQTSAYIDWIEKCTERRYAFGYDNPEENSESGEDCLISSRQTAYKYLGIIDARIEDGMDGYDI